MYVTEKPFHRTEIQGVAGKCEKFGVFPTNTNREQK